MRNATLAVIGALMMQTAALPALAEGDKAEVNDSRFQFNVANYPASTYLGLVCEKDNLELIGKSSRGKAQIPDFDARMMELEAKLAILDGYKASNFTDEEAQSMEKKEAQLRHYYAQELNHMRSQGAMLSAQTVLQMCLRHAEPIGRQFDLERLARLEAEEGVSPSDDDPFTVVDIPLRPEAKRRMLEAIDKTISLMDLAIAENPDAPEERIAGWKAQKELSIEKRKVWEAMVTVPEEGSAESNAGPIVEDVVEAVPDVEMPEEAPAEEEAAHDGGH